MNSETAKTLAWCAGILLLLGFVVGAPSGSFALMVLAALCAAVPSAFGRKKVRIVALGLFLLAIACGAVFFQAFRREQDTYRQGARERAKPPAAGQPAER